jgi:type II secretory pathway component PulF
MTLVEPAIILLLAGVVGWVVYSLVTGMLAVTNTAGM